MEEEPDLDETEKALLREMCNVRLDKCQYCCHPQAKLRQGSVFTGFSLFTGMGR